MKAAIVLLALTAAIANGADLRKTIVNGAELTYADEGTGETVVFVHSLGSDLRAWDAIRPYITSNFRFVAYSRRHHWPNAWADDGASHTIPQHIEDLAGFIRALNVGKVHVVAASLGARIAGRMVVKYPELVQSIVVSDGLLASPGDEASKQAVAPFWKQFEPFAAAVKARDGNSAVVAMVEWVTGKPGAWLELDAVRKGYYSDNAPALLLAFNGPPLAPPSCEEFGALPVATIVIAGEGTPLAFDITNRRLAECVGRGTGYRRVPSAGHFWYADNPRAAADLIIGFLERHPVR